MNIFEYIPSYNKINYIIYSILKNKKGILLSIENLVSLDTRKQRTLCQSGKHRLSSPAKYPQQMLQKSLFSFSWWPKKSSESF